MRRAAPRRCRRPCFSALVDEHLQGVEGRRETVLAEADAEVVLVGGDHVAEAVGGLHPDARIRQLLPELRRRQGPMELNERDGARDGRHPREQVTVGLLYERRKQRDVAPDNNHVACKEPVRGAQHHDCLELARARRAGRAEVLCVHERLFDAQVPEGQPCRCCVGFERIE